jgi:folate-binding protein YgfZ
LDVVESSGEIAMTGYDQLRDAAAWLDLTGRGKIKVTGEDRARLLHAMTTNDIQHLKPGQGCYAFFLNAQGRILADVNVLCFEDHLLLDSEPELAAKIYEHLDKFIIADDVLLEDLTSSLATIAIEGPRSTDVLAAAGAPVPEIGYAHARWGSRIVARLSYTGSPGFFVITRRDDDLRGLGAAEADREAFETVRIEHAKPRYGADISERYLAQETNLMHALHFNKGCYLGQEIVERVRSRAQIHRRLWAVALDGSELPPPGTKLMAAEKPAAEITSAAYSPRLGMVAALAYVRVEYERPGTELLWGDHRANVTGPSHDSNR